MGIKGNSNGIMYHIDQISSEGELLLISGFACCKDESIVSIVVRSLDGTQLMDALICRQDRADIAKFLLNSQNGEGLGFQITVKNMEKVKLEFTAGPFQEQTVVGAKSPMLLLKKKKQEIDFKKQNKAYNKLMAKYRLYAEHIQEQKKEIEQFAYKPKLSLVVPLYQPNVNYFKQFVNSVLQQTYENFELCIACGTKGDINLSQLLRKYKSEDIRFDFRILDLNEGISGNTNRAIEMAKGDVIIFADQDDLLVRDAFFQIVKCMNENPDAGLIYTDEDKVTMDSKVLYEPHFKPDFSPDLLCSNNYISHLTAIKKTLLDQIGYLNPEFDGAQDYDLVLRAVEQTKQVAHVSKVLYHWRSHPGSTAAGGGQKLYALEAGKRALEAHLQRTNVSATVSMMNESGYYALQYPKQEIPPISVVLTSMDKGRGMNGIWNKSEQLGFTPLEVLMDTPMTGLSNTPKGEYILFLNASAEFEDAKWLDQLLGVLARKDVAAAGGCLTYRDGRIHSMGMCYRRGEVFSMFEDASMQIPAYSNRNRIIQNVSILNLDCMLVKAECFLQAGGIKKGVSQKHQALDLCLNLRKLGYRLVSMPTANLKISSLVEDAASIGKIEEKDQAPINGLEVGICTAWEQVLQAPDPYFSPQLKQTAKGLWELNA